MGDDGKLRAFVLDDHEVVRHGLRTLIDADGGMEVVGEAGTAAEALERIPACAPRVAVLDVRLPTATASRCAGTSKPNTTTTTPGTPTTT